MADLNIKLVLSAIDRLSPVVARAVQGLHRSLGDIKTQTEPVRAALANLAGPLRTAGLAAGALAGGAALGLGAVVKAAAAAETYAATLETIEGSAEKARAALAWIGQFEASTPYNLDEVTEAFVRLRAYGLEPTGGLLRALGDTASAMGKPLIQAVEAIADAVTGENERLKEFGIRAETSGKKVTYTWIENGKTMRRTIKADAATIQRTLMDILGGRYAGAMERQSRTWSGLISSIQSQVVTFLRAIGDSGPFQILKEQLSGFLAGINDMQASGQLQAIAADIGGMLTSGLRDLVAVARGAIGVLRDVHDLFGSWQPLILGVAAVFAGPLVLAIGQVVAAMIPLTAVLLANPFGALAVAAVAAAALIISHWGEVKAFFAGLFDWIRVNAPIVGDALSFVGRVARGISGALSATASRIDAGPKFSALPAQPAAGRDASVSGQINVKIDAPPGTRVTKVESKGPVGLGVDVGVLMVP